jgi:hypothetical protein
MVGREQPAADIVAELMGQAVSALVARQVQMTDANGQCI